MKKTSMRALALVMTLVMVLGMLPAGLLSFTAAAEEASEKTIYVATTGSDTEGDGSEANPYATIQKAVNEVPADNTVPTTILIADGAYNVFLKADDPNAVHSDGNTLMIGKSNLTLKAQNPLGAIIYAYSSGASYGDHNYSVVRILNGENVSIEDLVILPNFSANQVDDSWKTMDVADYILTDYNGLSIDGLFGDATQVYYYRNTSTREPLICTDSAIEVDTNNGLQDIFGLTIKNCYLNDLGSLAIELSSDVKGDYHIVGNTFTGHHSIDAYNYNYSVYIKGAGTEAIVKNEICDNIFVSASTAADGSTNYPKQIRFSSASIAANKLPVIAGNIFKGENRNINNSTLPIHAAEVEYTDGELSVMCQTNSVQLLTGKYKYLVVDSKKIKVVSANTNVDTTIDTEEELVYWLEQGDVTLGGDITVTKDILPAEITANLNFGEYSITKDAALDISAPEGYTWLNGTTLAIYTQTHTHVPAAEWSTDGEYHWHVCTAPVGDEACTEQLNKEGHSIPADDHSCLTAEQCTVCLLTPNPAQTSHSFDTDCTTADKCQNAGCEQKAAATTFHTFTDGSDTSCNTPDCTYTREPIEGKIIYVATTGSDTEGDGSQTKPYATIQKAVNEVPANNTDPITILIADGAYNVHVTKGSANDALPNDSYGHNLMIAKSNLTLQAVNKQMVVLYGYADSVGYIHTDGSVLTIRNSTNVTIDGLVILPHLVNNKEAGGSSSDLTKVQAAYVNVLVQSILGESVGDLFDGVTTVYQFLSANRGMVRLGEYATAASNGSVSTNDGLTFKNCYFDAVNNGPAFYMDKQTTGDYHIIGNTFASYITINGAGNAADVASEIRDNTFINQKTITLQSSIQKLPVIEGNTFKDTDTTNIGDTTTLISNKSTGAKYTAGELAVMALTNSVANTDEYNNLKYDTANQIIAVTGSSPDTTVDTEEELVYWLSLGDVTLTEDITVTKDILPDEITSNLIFGSYKVTKDAAADIPAPEGYTWLYGTTLTEHTHDFETDKWSKDIGSHWRACKTEGCYVKRDEASHSFEDDFDCTTAESCSTCGWESDKQDAHDFDDDGDCTTDDKCENPGCAKTAGRNEFHIFTDRRDATCNAPGCAYERELLKEDVIYVATTGSDETGDGSMERPFATIQRAVNDVPANNTVPTTILIADGLYNVFLDKYDPMRMSTNGSTLAIGKSNLTLKAVNKHKVVIYAYSDASTTTYDHYNNSVLRIDNSMNLTFDGLVILPHFADAKGTSTWIGVSAADYNDLLRELLGEMEDVFVGDAAGKIYFNNNQAMIRTDTYGKVHTNGTVTTVSGLTFKNCYLDGMACTNVINLNSTNITGDYHFIGNTITGNLSVNGAGNAAEVESEIRDNTFINKKTITIKGSVQKLPVIEGNTFEGNTETVITVSSNTKYTAGEMSVMCQTNEISGGKYLYVDGNDIKVTDTVSKVDTKIDTVEELVYWLALEGEYTLAGDITLTEALPANMEATLVLGGYTITNPAGLESPAPEGFCWVTSNVMRAAVSTLAPHDWSATYVPEVQNGVTTHHYIYCTNCQLEKEGTREACTPKTVAEGDRDCTVAICCTLCDGINVAATSHDLNAAVNAGDTYHKQSCKNCDQIIETAHEAADDGSCLTADVCVCGYVVQEAKPAHSYVQVKRDANGHWYQCEWCASTTAVEAHTGGTATCAKRASCAVCYKEYGQLNAENHSFTNYISDNNATCELNGTKTAVCDWCATAKNTVTDEDAVPSHNFEGQAWKAGEDGHYMECVNFTNCGGVSEKVAHSGGAANCSAQAQCEACGASYGELAADVHSFTDYISDGNATCEADGTKTAKCDDCSVATDTVADTGSILGHSYTNYVSNNDATCLADGTETATCDNGCDRTVTRRALNSAIGHSFTNYERTGDATCVSDGTKTAVCDNGCGAVSTVADPGSALGHSFTNFVSDGNATCTADGTKTAVCDNGCGSSESVVDAGSATGHNFDGKDWVSNKDGHWVRCDCGEKSLSAHTPVVSGAKEATKDETGYTGDTGCEICGYQIAKGEIIAKLADSQPDGLSTGAIVAIVVGSVAVVGLLGFAGYWFLIKKKP